MRMSITIDFHTAAGSQIDVVPNLIATATATRGNRSLKQTEQVIKIGEGLMSVFDFSWHLLKP